MLDKRSGVLIAATAAHMALQPANTHAHMHVQATYCSRKLTFTVNMVAINGPHKQLTVSSADLESGVAPTH